MRLKPLIISFLTLGSLLSISQANECLNLHEDKARLACYDKQLGYEKKLSSAENNGNWNIVTDVSPIDDTTRIYLDVTADKKVGSGFRASTPILFIRCESNKTELYIDWGVFITTGRTLVTTRVDKKKAQDAYWSMSTDHQASFAAKSIPLIKSMIEGENLLVRITPYGENPYTVNFNISGLENAITPVRETCGW